MTQLSNVDRLRKLQEITTEALLNASDEELLDDIREAGDDPEQVAACGIAAFQSALGELGRQNLMDARTELDRRRDPKSSTSSRKLIPDDPVERRSLLSRLLKHGDLPQSLTLAFREGGNGIESMSDEDIESSLEDFELLGYIDDES